MNSPIEICNSALVKCGAAPIMSFADGTPNADICQIRYDSVRRAVLRSHPWNSAMKRAALPALSSTPAFGNALQYQLPSDCLRVIMVNGCFYYQKDDWWKVESRLILTSNVFVPSSDALDVKYITDLTDVSVMNEQLAETIAAALAWDISFRVTQSFQLRQLLSQEFRIQRSRATLVDSQEGSVQQMRGDTFLDSRLAGTTGVAWGQPLPGTS